MSNTLRNEAPYPMQVKGADYIEDKCPHCGKFTKHWILLEVSEETNKYEHTGEYECSKCFGESDIFEFQKMRNHDQAEDMVKYVSVLMGLLFIVAMVLQ